MKDIKQLLGKRIKELRLTRGFSQEKLAGVTNIDQRNLSNIECGNTFPSKCLLDLGAALQVNLIELFDFEHHTLDEIEMINYIKDNLNKLQPHDIRTIYRLIKSMS